MLEVWRMVLKSGRASPTPTASAQPDSPSPVNTKQQLSLNRATFLLKSATFYQENVAALAEDDVVQLRECDRRRCSVQCDSDAIVRSCFNALTDRIIGHISRKETSNARQYHSTYLCPVAPTIMDRFSLSLTSVPPSSSDLSDQSSLAMSTRFPSVMSRPSPPRLNKSQESQRAQHNKSQESPENRAQ